MSKKNASRLNEWFVPKFGPIQFRIAIGILFLPYTAMCISFALLGSLISPLIYWDRIASIILIYFFALGIGAHFADNIGSRKKPWGEEISRRVSWFILLSSLSVAYSIGIYYIVLYVPFLSVIAVAEGFLLFAYNFEKFGGRFHTNLWFVIAWGALPVLAGFMIQTNAITLESILVAAVAGVISYFEISLSRPYKILKHRNMENGAASRLEKYLKIISLGTLTVAMVSVALRSVLG
ncbi:MAG TPA: hypothetical protein VE130_07430 [Nitrososphaeraceae archaeon]|jgi:hypothetical protein|nr:hypothetical protein [Nitrososphaeraceae archaeon]